ncbi:CheW-like domain-containing protein [Butyrivibrio hungatei DSM 14810]|uniref:histidine kinase n=1 Tax=Butyrivibrio hungatei DSM 14810 TaxID=1121132 RepID=A0A1M7S5T8_9FIRM|nr:chemotaxis protein CheW [Butyrivibrio hungatei]SHN53790.1 CheW-like domain-containing protein [Butyrivibrio hungatei DSM 14810]
MDTNQLMVLGQQTGTYQALIVSISNELFAIPLSTILSIENVAVSELSQVDNDDVIYLRGKVIPLVYLDRVFNMEPSPKKENLSVVVCMYNHSYFGFVVDALNGQKEIETKSLGVLDDNDFFTGASILDDDVALILNIPSFVTEEVRNG